MNIVEPDSVYRARQAAKAVTPPTVPSRQSLDDAFWTEAVFRSFQHLSGNVVKITSLVNAAVRQGKCTKRNERETEKLRVLKLIGSLIKTGRLVRFKRKYVRLAAKD
jgi:hypothetical protein